jgi:hypothetical protein
VPYGYKTDYGYRLGQWIASQRKAKARMDAVRRQRLEALAGWSWNVEVPEKSVPVFRPSKEIGRRLNPVASIPESLERTSRRGR